MGRDLEARVLEARLERLERVRRLRQVAANAGEVVVVELHGQAQPRAAQERFCLRRVVRVGLDFVGVAEEPRRHELLRHHPAAAPERLHDLRAVEAVRNRLPNLELVHRRLCLIDTDVEDVEGRPVEHLQLIVLLDRRDVLRPRKVVRLHLARLKRLQARRVVGDRLEDQAGKLRLGAPVRRVANEHDLLTEIPGVEPVRARSDRVLGRERPRRVEDPVRVDGPGVGLVLLERRRARDPEGAEAKRTQERRRRAGQGETHAVLPKRRAALEERRPNQLGRARLADARLEAPEHVLPVVGGVRVLELGAEVVPAVEVETDGRRVERSVVLELDPVAEVERPDSASSCAFPARREGRHGEGRSGLEVDEAVEDLVDNTDGGRILDQRSVENHRVSLDTDGKRPAGSGASLLVYPGAGARPKRAEYGNCGERDDDPGTGSTHKRSSFLAGQREV